MEFWLVTTLGLLFAFGDGFQDPVHRLWWGRTNGRNLHCEWVPHEEAHQKYPYQIPRPEPRRFAQQERQALLCTPRSLLRDGVRNPRDDRILAELSSNIDEATVQALATQPNAHDWYVEVHHPELQMAQKVLIATQTRLAQSHPRVHAQTPLPTPGDVSVLSSLPLQDSLPIYCQRRHQEGNLQPTDAVLVLALLHPQETIMHAGTCAQGGWRWLF